MPRFFATGRVAAADGANEVRGAPRDPSKE
jgi:hypothetical protein